MDTADNTSNRALHDGGSDITLYLMDLMDAGWDEGDIIKLIKIRGVYGRLGQDYTNKVGHTKGSPDPNHLKFIRWLYSKGHLQS